MKPALFTLAIVVSAAAVGCSAGPDLQMQVDDLTRENEDLRRKNTQLEGQLAATEARASMLEREASRKAPAAAKSDMTLSDDLARRGISLKRRGADTIIDIPSDVFFASGSSVLSKDGEKVLREVAGMVKRQFPGAMVRVEGHADSDPIRRTKSRFHCNWELSFERAHAVAHFLMEKSGMDPKRLAVDCYGEHQPQDASNKAKNRRVELVVQGP